MRLLFLASDIAGRCPSSSGLLPTQCFLFKASPQSSLVDACAERPPSAISPLMWPVLRFQRKASPQKSSLVDVCAERSPSAISQLALQPSIYLSIHPSLFPSGRSISSYFQTSPSRSANLFRNLAKVFASPLPTVFNVGFVFSGRLFPQQKI